MTLSFGSLSNAVSSGSSLTYLSGTRFVLFPFRKHVCLFVCLFFFLKMCEEELLWTEGPKAGAEAAFPAGFNFTS